MGVVLYIVDHQAGGVEHLNYMIDDLKRLAGDGKPDIESLDEESADFFGSIGGYISKGFQNERLISLRPLRFTYGRGRVEERK